MPAAPLQALAQLACSLVQAGGLHSAQADTWLGEACEVLLEAWVELLAELSFSARARCAVIDGSGCVWARWPRWDALRLLQQELSLSHHSDLSGCCRSPAAPQEVVHAAQQVFAAVVQGSLADAAAGALDDEVH